MPFDKNKLNRPSLDIPAPRGNEPLDEDLVRSQQAGGQPGNPMLALELEVDPTDIFPEKMLTEVSDIPLSNVDFEQLAGNDDVDIPPMGMMV